MGHPQHSQLPASLVRQVGPSKAPSFSSPTSVSALQSQALQAANEALRKELQAQQRHLQICREEMQRCMAELTLTRAKLSREQENVALLHATLCEVDAPLR